MPIRGERASEYARVERPVRVGVVVLSDGLIPLRRVPDTALRVSRECSIRNWPFSTLH